MIFLSSYYGLFYCSSKEWVGTRLDQGVCLQDAEQQLALHRRCEWEFLRAGQRNDEGMVSRQYPLLPKRAVVWGEMLWKGWHKMSNAQSNWLSVGRFTCVPEMQQDTRQKLVRRIRSLCCTCCTPYQRWYPAFRSLFTLKDTVVSMQAKAVKLCKWPVIFRTDIPHATSFFFETLTRHLFWSEFSDNISANISEFISPSAHDPICDVYRFMTFPFNWHYSNRILHYTDHLGIVDQ